MSKVSTAIKRFFFPPPGSSRTARVLPYAILGVLTLAVLIASAYGWEYTNSPSFCGTTCHTMPPEFNSYLVSPHARIACVECHIGRGFIATQITRKAGDLKHVFYTVFQNYTYPIYAGEMRPARDTCERCHFPEKFSDDSLREIRLHQDDIANTPYSIYLTIKTGGGSARQGLGRGVHWHIENKILYYATDEHEETIPYIRVYAGDGSYSEYIDLESGFDPSTIDEADLREMDCITCHNRITHLVNLPETSMDVALDANLIDISIPEIRRKGVEVLRGSYTSDEMALTGIASLDEYYQTVYPDYYAEHTASIQAAIAAIQDIYTQSVSLDQLSDWNTHPNHIGHQTSPGCFRCHDGKHMTADQEAIRLECNLCHSIPVVASEFDFTAAIQLSRGPEPQSHLNTSWIAQHHLVFNPTCSNCHTTSNPGGTDNTSFCSNSACHGSAWTYAGFDAPALRELIAASLPPAPPAEEVSTEGPLTYNGVIGALFQARCSSCHGSGGIAGLDLSTYQSAMSGGENGAVILPGDAQGSPLVQKQSADLPHFGQFTPDELQLVIDWIDAGAPEQ